MFSFKKILPLLIVLILGLIAIPLLVIFAGQNMKDQDLQRIAHVSIIAEALEEMKKNGFQLPLPQNAVHVQVGETIVGYQGVVTEKIFRQIGIKTIKDPETHEPYHYYLSADQDSYEILTTLDAKQHQNGSKFYDINTFSKGSSVGNFIKINTGQFAGDFIHMHTKNGQSIDLLNEEKRSQLGIFIPRSCLELLEKRPNSSTGVHLLNIDNEVFPVYCDMDTDGGGWTLFYANHGHDDDPNPTYSYVQLRDILGTGQMNSLYDISNQYLSGLLDYSHFTRNGAQDVLITNNATESNTWLKASFSSPQALHWALGPTVLGKSDEACIAIPNADTWSITNQDGSVAYTDLTHIMNHNGASWGVSHDKYWCNGHITAHIAHFAFYVAHGTENETRTRGIQNINGSWGGENQFRYFIR